MATNAHTRLRIEALERGPRRARRADALPSSAQAASDVPARLDRMDAAAAAGETARAMRVLKKQEFVGRLDQRLAHVLLEHLPPSARGSLHAIRRDVRYEVLALLRQRGKRVRGITKQAFLAELERSRLQVLAGRERALAELAELERRTRGLRAERERLDARGDSSLAPPGRLAAPRAGAAPRAASERARTLLQQSGLARHLPRALEAEVLAFALSVVDAERTAAAVDDKDREIGRLERRIAKLSRSLLTMENALQELARLKDVELGEASLYRTVQGLSELDDRYTQKKELLEEIFTSNVELRAALAG